MRACINLLLASACMSMISGCAVTRFYDSVPAGKLEGKVVVQWLEPDQFIFLPDPIKPLRFTRADGTQITPARMLTDGGSIPRPLWILRNYSPWGYAPAFIVHDWLFEVKHCQLQGHDTWTHKDAANVMAEVMKELMTSKRVDVDKPTLYSMHLAVSSPIAAKLWSEGACVPPPADLRPRKVIAEYEINF